MPRPTTIPATSQGIFVFTSATPAVSVGNVVTVRGTASEFFELTQIEASLPGDVNVTASNAALPSAITLTSAILDPAGTPDQLERFEGMRLIAASLTSVAPTDEFGEIATVLTGVPQTDSRTRASRCPTRCRPIRQPGCRTAAFPASTRTPNASSSTRGAGGHAGRHRDVTCRHRQCHGAARLLVRRVQDSAGTAPDGWPEHQRRSPFRFRRPANSPSAGFNIENFAGNDTRRREGSAGDPAIDAITGRHRSHRDPRSSRHCNRWPSRSTLTPSQPANRTPPTRRSSFRLRHCLAAIRRRRTSASSSRHHACAIDAVSQELASETFVNPNNGQTETLHDRPPLVLRATVDPSGSQPAAGHRHRQSPALVHRYRSRGRRGTTRAGEADGAGRVGGPPAAGTANDEPGRRDHLDRRLQRVSVQRRVHRSDRDAEGRADARRSDCRRRRARTW